MKKMSEIIPRPSIYIPEFIAANQTNRADNIIKMEKKSEALDQIRTDIRDFKKCKELDQVIVIWTANTERFSEEIEGLNDTSDNLLRSICKNESEISPSTLFAVASILEGVRFFVFTNYKLLLGSEWNDECIDFTMICVFFYFCVCVHDK